jgi:hypothetical protein
MKRSLHQGGPEALNLYTVGLASSSVMFSLFGTHSFI